MITFIVVLLQNATNVTYFRGFIVQARRMADPTGDGVGNFLTNSSNDQQTRCSDVSIYLKCIVVQLMELTTCSVTLVAEGGWSG